MEDSVYNIFIKNLDVDRNYRVILNQSDFLQCVIQSQIHNKHQFDVKTLKVNECEYWFLWKSATEYENLRFCWRLRPEGYFLK